MQHNHIYSVDFFHISTQVKRKFDSVFFTVYLHMVSCTV